MKRFLLASTAIVALASHLHVARAADIDAVGNVDYPTTFISFEGGVMLDASPSNLSFDDEDDKLGGLDSLQPGDWGGQGRVELGHRLNSEWDFKVGLAEIFLGEDTAQGAPDLTNTDIIEGEANASQKTSLQLVDLEVGYDSQDVGALQTRLFAGVRGLHSTTDAGWVYEGQAVDIGDDEKLGNFNDEVYAIGPRVGVDLALPLNDSNILLVGSASGSVLFGNIESQYEYDDNDSR